MIEFKLNEQFSTDSSQIDNNDERITFLLEYEHSPRSIQWTEYDFQLSETTWKKNEQRNDSNTKDFE